MIKVAVIGRDHRKIKALKSELKKRGYESSFERPDIVLCFGGDGMFLIAERVFPHAPKILFKDSRVGKKAVNLGVWEVLKRFEDKQYTTEHLRKLKATAKGRFEYRRLEGINDITMRNLLPTEAIRFRYKINGGKWSEKIIGDGIVIATPYGSGGYFSSITGKNFKKGMGIAFNNPTTRKNPVMMKDASKIVIEILRGEAVLVADNNRDSVHLKRLDKVTIKLSKKFAKRITL